MDRHRQMDSLLLQIVITYPDNSTTDNPLLDFSKPTGTVASSNLLGILLVGGVLMALIFGGSGDKKKKKK